MGQIVKRKKKGRPPKVDPAAREQDSDLRRSLRRRNVKYAFDLDDYFDEEEFYPDDEERRRREKKLKHLLSAGETESTTAHTGRSRRVDRATAAYSSASSSSDEGGEKLCKKRKIEEYVYDDVDGENEDVNAEDNYNDEDEEEVKDRGRERKPARKAKDSPPGTPGEGPSGLPLPDKKALELILDKLQKKDIYGVYAEPVDPEELPDYHDVIEHPMDFATVRNKLRNGLYASFEQFESDVFLICSNAMQYNSPDTVYFKQARSIQELAKSKFQKIRLNMEGDVKPEQRMRPGSNLKKQIKRSVSRTLQEPVGSDFSSGATLATTDFHNVTNAQQVVGSEKHSVIDGFVEGNSFLNDNNYTDRVEEPVLGKGLLSRCNRKSCVPDENRKPCLPDENRRATYNISLSELKSSTESLFSTFEGETKLLVPVGLYSDHSYARSLARFSATLGSFAWKAASKRIEQVLPQGYKFGRGWVGEYEPHPTPVVVLGNCTVKEPPFLAKKQPATDPEKSRKTPTFLDSSKEFAGGVPFLEQKFPFLGPAGIRPPPVSVMPTQPIRVSASEVKPSFFLAPGIKPGAASNYSYQNSQLRESAESDRQALKQVELNGPPSSGNKNTTKSAGSKQTCKSSETDSPRLTEFSSKNIKFSPSGSFKQPNGNRVTFGASHDGKATGNRVGGSTIADSSSDLVKPTSYYPHEHGQARSDPVQLRISAEKARHQQNLSTMPVANTPEAMPSAPSSTSANSNNASAVAARAWMSVGAGGMRPVAETPNMNKNQIFADSLYNTTREIQSQLPQFRGEFPPGMHTQMDKSKPQIGAFVPRGPIPMIMNNQTPFPNHQMVFPQLATADLSRFQMQQPNWQNLNPQVLSRQKPESLPPDLNIGFQSSGSPGRPSSGVLVDSQQPDLALQL